MKEMFDPDTAEKLQRLHQELAGMGSAVIAYSGGVDSTFLIRIAYEVMGDNCLAVIACSETYPQAELKNAIETVKAVGAPWQVVETSELANEKFASNPPDRCAHCKSELFSKLFCIAEEKGLAYVLDGANANDIGDYRPGMQAGHAMGVRSPLLEAGLSKEEIRLVSRELGLSTWDKPSFACLSSRFPYGERITTEKLQQIDQAESFLRGLGLRQLRVRHHNTIARLEVPREDFTTVTGPLLDRIVNRLKELGFTYVTLDLQGFRSGSMNEVLPKTT